MDELLLVNHRPRPIERAAEDSPIVVESEYIWVLTIVAASFNDKNLHRWILCEPRRNSSSGETGANDNVVESLAAGNIGVSGNSRGDGQHAFGNDCEHRKPY